MSRTRYTDEDKARLLGEFEAGGGSAAAFCRERGISYQTFVAWRCGRRLARHKPRAAVEFLVHRSEPGYATPVRRDPRAGELD